MLRLWVEVLSLALALSACGASALQSEPEPPRAPSLADADAAVVVEAAVTRAVDGNSLDAHVGGNRTVVGYLGVETPTSNQPCGQEALARNRELVGNRVLLQEHPDHRFDERGRRLYYAYTVDGVSIDEVLVREGLGRAARTDAPYGAHLAALQAEAEAEGRGCLWRRDQP